MERDIQTVIFFIFLFSLFGFIQWYVVRSYIRWLGRVVSDDLFSLYKRIGLGVLFAANIIFLLRFPSTDMGWYQFEWFQALIIYPGGVFFGAIVLAFVFLLVTNSSAWIYHTSASVKNRGSAVFKTVTGFFSLYNGDRVFDNNRSVDHLIIDGEAPENDQASVSDKSSYPDALMSRRSFLATTGTAIMTAPVAFTIGASVATAHDYQIIHKKLYFPDLPSGLNGLRIVQLSDIHSGIYMTERQIRDIFRLVNEQHPDIIALTGDHVDNSISEIPSLYNALPDLKSEYGIFSCLGNHDHYASAASVTSALRQRNIRVLINDHDTLRINGETLTMLGVDDLVSGTTGQNRLDRAVTDMEHDGFRILLSHRPDLFDPALNHGVDLTLAGHTHGGQIGFDLLGMPLYPIYLFQKYPKGLFEVDRNKLYVNVGIGMVGVPVRTVRPELTVIELTSDATSAA